MHAPYLHKASKHMASTTRSETRFITLEAAVYARKHAVLSTGQHGNSPAACTRQSSRYSYLLFRSLHTHCCLLLVSGSQPSVEYLLRTVNWFPSWLLYTTQIYISTYLPHFYTCGKSVPWENPIFAVLRMRKINNTCTSIIDCTALISYI